MSNMSKRVLLLLFGVVFLALLFWYSSALQDQFFVIVDFFHTLVYKNELLAIGVFILTAVVGALISPFTNLPLVPFAVAIWGTVPTTLFLLAGWMIGDTIAYFIGRYYGRKAVTFFVSEEKLDHWSEMVKAHTNFFTALILRLALPAELGYAFGFVRYHFGLFLLITLIAEVPFAIISTTASEAVLERDVGEFFWLILLLVIIIVGALMKLNVVKRKQG